MVYHRLWNVLGPIFLSALSIFITFNLIQPIALLLDPTFSLFANKGLGKIGLVILVIIHALTLFAVAGKFFLKKLLETSLSFFTTKQWFKTFFIFFIIFFLAHALLVPMFIATQTATYNPSCWAQISSSFFLKLIFGFIATFFLAWTEEFIFRGALYQFLAQELSPFFSAIITSIIFMAAHDLRNPFNLVTTQWQLGLGLFLLGLLLNLIFIITKKLYANMGAHAGLVFVKVIMRRFPILVFTQFPHMPWWLSQDLRQSFFIHASFVMVIISIVIYHRKRLFT